MLTRQKSITRERRKWGIREQRRHSKGYRAKILGGGRSEFVIMRQSPREISGGIILAIVNPKIFIRLTIVFADMILVTEKFIPRVKIIRIISFL